MAILKISLIETDERTLTRLREQMIETSFPRR